MIWGIIPAAGGGSRIQPLAFSKELLPVGSRQDGAVERPRAVSEYLVERLIRAGATNLCFVISPGKSDILQYYGGSIRTVHICYTVQPRPGGLCEAVFCALPLIQPDDVVMVGLPDTIWLPEDGLCSLRTDLLSFLLFPVERPEDYDVVIDDDAGSVREIQVKPANPASSWVWGAFKMPGRVMHDLYHLWCERERRDEYFGTLVNAYLARGGEVCAVHAGQAYIDVGTINGYREAIRLLGSQQGGRAEAVPAVKRGRRKTDIGNDNTTAQSNSQGNKR